MDISRLKKLRVKKGLSQQQLAKALGVSTSAIGMYELGQRKPDHDLLIKMSRFFDVSVDYLIGNETSDDVEKILHSVKDLLYSSSSVMLKGEPLNEEDTELILSALSDGLNTVFDKRRG